MLTLRNKRNKKNADGCMTGRLKATSPSFSRPKFYTNNRGKPNEKPRPAAQGHCRHSRNGTRPRPLHSDSMARINFPKDEVRAKLGDDPNRVLTIYEPTCGAGGIIVASIDVLNGYGVNYAWNVFVDCGDIDSRCVHMTYLTLSLLGVPAVVRLGDALAMEYREAWFTPAYLIAWPHFFLQKKPRKKGFFCHFLNVSKK